MQILGFFLYTIFLKLYPAGLHLASLWNDKAKLWINGRKKFPEINNYKIAKKSIWMHCASLGEFEQGRPVLEKLKVLYPEHLIVLTFFSPSGFEIEKNYKGADHVFYIPIDSSTNAKRFIDLINPELVVWVKYEFWYHYLKELNKRNITVLLISGAFRSTQPFFKWYGNFWRKILSSFTFFFLQNGASEKLLNKINVKNTTISGDTRFDRVISIAENFTDLSLIKSYCNGAKVIVAGSTWEDDEAGLVHYTQTNKHIKFIIAPHEIDKGNLKVVKKTFTSSIYYSELAETTKANSNILIMDNIGMLSGLYNYADITYVGGGFGDDGLHNILEAAVYGKPVIFGPQIERNLEAQELIDACGGFIIENALQLEKTLNYLLRNPVELIKAGKAAKEYVYKNAGATEKIINYIQENRLLTN